MSLTNTTIRNAKLADRPFKLFDERGLFLLISPAGGKWWRLTKTRRSSAIEHRYLFGLNSSFVESGRLMSRSAAALSNGYQSTIQLMS